MEYRKVCKFKYNSENFQLLIDNNNRYFFLKINGNGNYKYVTLEEYLALSSIFLRPANIMNAERSSNGKRINITPKVLLKGTAFVLTLTLLNSCSSYIKDAAFKPSDINIQNSAYSQTYERPNIESSLSFDVVDQEEALKEDTYFVADIYKNIYVYDMDYLDNVLPDTIKNPTKQDLINAVNSNRTMSDSFRKYILEYIDLVTAKYPNIEYRVFYENLKTLDVQELSRDQLTVKTMSADAVACYDNSKNAIYVLKGNEYEKGSWEYQTLFHELSHALRTKWFTLGEYDARIQAWGPNLNLSLVNEMLNSVFAVSLYDDDLLTFGEKDVAYQLQSNYMLILLDALDNYSIEDYVQHSVSHLATAMDEAHGDTNYGSVILNLINAQYEDFHSLRIEVEQKEYYPIYDYLCDLYFAKHIKPGMAYDDAKAVCDKMVNIIMFDVPEDYEIDVNRFYENFENYYSMINQNSNNSTEKEIQTR